MEAKLKIGYTYWKKGKIFKYNIKFYMYHMMLQQKDKYYYEMFVMDKAEFDEYFIDLNEERKLKILKLNKSLNK